MPEPDYSHLTESALQRILKPGFSSLPITYRITDKLLDSIFGKLLRGSDPVLFSLAERDLRLRITKKLYSTDEVPENSAAETRRYNLSVTDLFVETALDLLERKSRTYQTRGLLSWWLSIFVVAFGVFSAARSLESWTPIGGSLRGDTSTTSNWIDLLSHFIVAFTYYGFIVLTAVTLWRFGRAMLDQSERLHDRRHALRQGRLFVHLNGGNLSIEQMERAFAWNIAQDNAFANMHVDAKAPWGAALAELVKVIPELVKVGVEASQKEPKSATTQSTGKP